MAAAGKLAAAVVTTAKASASLCDNKIMLILACTVQLLELHNGIGDVVNVAHGVTSEANFGVS